MEHEGGPLQKISRCCLPVASSSYLPKQITSTGARKAFRNTLAFDTCYHTWRALSSIDTEAGSAAAYE